MHNVTLTTKQFQRSIRSCGHRYACSFRLNAVYRALAIGACLFLLSACSWQGGQQWRRSSCEELVNADDRERCLEEAMQSEGEYREKVRRASEPWPGSPSVPRATQ